MNVGAVSIPNPRCLGAHTRYERIDGGAKVYAEIPRFRGVWAALLKHERVIASENWTLPPELAQTLWTDPSTSSDAAAN